MTGKILGTWIKVPMPHGGELYVVANGAVRSASSKPAMLPFEAFEVARRLEDAAQAVLDTLCELEP